MRPRPTAAAVTGALVAALVLPTAAATATPVTSPLPLTEGFDDCALEGWEIVSADPDTSNTWTCSAYSNVEANGYGDGAAADEWLILPAVDLTAQDGEQLTFRAWTRWTDVTHPTLTVLVATDHARGGDPADATWTELDVPTLPAADSRSWTDVGPVDLAHVDGDHVSIALRYTSSGTGSGNAATWRVDDVAIAVPPDPEPACRTADEDLTLISEVQGPGDFSPLHGEEVTVRAVVTLAADTLDGYFLQEEPEDDDGDPATSEGIFVYDPRGGLPEAGATIELTGTVGSFRGLTQFSFPAIAVCDVAPVEIPATPLTLPLDDAGRESLEGMVVTNAQDLQVTRLFTAYRYGELGLALDGPLAQPTSVHAPGPDAEALAAANADRELIVNDRDEAWSQFSPFPWELFDEDLSAGDTMRAGDVVGPLNYTFGDFKVEPIGRFPETADTDAIQPAPALADGNDVVAFNVLNYFNTFGDSAELRGATNAEDFALQTERIVAAMLELDAAVYGLVEIENDYEEFHDDGASTVPALATLVEALNDAAGADVYAWIEPSADLLTDEGFGGLGPDAIAQALIYRTDRAEPVGPTATFDIDAELEGDADNNRWPLAQTFRIDGEFVEIVVNHLKSKGSSCTDTASPDFGFGDDVATDLTGNCNLTREYAVEQLLDWIAEGATGFPTDDTLVIGDLNAYEEEPPVELLVEAGFTDLVQLLGDDAFTYKFDGRFGRLDHAFASPSLAAKVTDAAVWQVNSRAPYGYLYDNSPQDGYPLWWASSDHDPVVVSIASDGRNGTAGNGKAPKRR